MSWADDLSGKKAREQSSNALYLRRMFGFFSFSAISR